MAALAVVGVVHLLTQGTAVAGSLRQRSCVGPLPIPGYGLAGIGGAFLIARAFASGCTALTGVEAISDGVPAFKPPEWRNARTTLMVRVGILAVTFAGITFLAHQFQLQPNFIPGSGGLAPQMEDIHNYNGQPYQTILSKLARVVFGSGGGPAYLYVQATTALILALAANTSFSDFPRLLYFMARDKFAPSQFLSLGDRLAFSNRFITLCSLASASYTAFPGTPPPPIPPSTPAPFLTSTP